MKNQNVRRRLSVFFLLGVSVSLVAAPGCGDDTVRGAGSIEVPKRARFDIADQAAARRGKTAGIPSHSR